MADLNCYLQSVSTALSGQPDVIVKENGGSACSVRGTPLLVMSDSGDAPDRKAGSLSGKKAHPTLIQRR